MSAVLFDLYETLVTEHDVDRAHPAEELGLSVEEYRTRWAAIKTDRLTGRIATYREAVSIIAPAASRATIERVAQRRLASKKRVLGEVDASVIAMLRALRCDGVRIAVVSNCAEEDVAFWSRSPLAELVHAAVFSCEVGIVKPDAAIYELGCAEVGVGTKQAVFVGDGGFDELAGAARAGLEPLWATWFLERWPPDQVADALSVEGFLRVRRPAEVVKHVERRAGP